MQIASIATIKLVDWTTFKGFFQGSISLILVAVLTQSPIFFSWVLSANHSNLSTDYMRKKIGTLYQGVSLADDAPFGLSIMIVFLLRRSLFVLITFSLLEHPGL